jgi:hypothetical protein
VCVADSCRHIDGMAMLHIERYQMAGLILTVLTHARRTASASCRYVLKAYPLNLSSVLIAAEIHAWLPSLYTCALLALEEQIFVWSLHVPKQTQAWRL